METGKTVKLIVKAWGGDAGRSGHRFVAPFRTPGNP